MPLKFRDVLIKRPKVRGIDAVCQLQHFAIITYAVAPERLVGLIPGRFRLDEVAIDGRAQALISVVPFLDVDFTSAVFPFPKFQMGQTNYRVYIVDTATGERGVWFLGTTLDSWTVAIPRHIWKLPWHPGQISFDCEYDPQTGRYKRYRMRTEAEWAPAEVELSQSTERSLCLPGFPDTESALVYLTHPLVSFYHRRDGRVGTYRVWHQQLMVQPASLISAHFGLLSRTGLVSAAEQQSPHSALVQPIVEFTIYLPPEVVASES
ncbi:MAG: DUF2071 domain-containing protein [Chloroflexi bacterium]|nr:DUF2071 domain-containing protein [Ardenticatenaceae bacterium]MBL1130678.1 DUF2071 domain-containing protein [Chloroflexota bacterium]NOG36772.1 DUF2071 domain-containing protein [Chloroflexota bacterium]GIK57110.1 MAG: hypothetical protein BroJett015_27730 [Chloroflexota bacterium]